MKVGLQLPYYTYPGGPPTLAATFARIVREAEAAGFASLWVMDHYFTLDVEGPPDLEMLECYSTRGWGSLSPRSAPGLHAWRKPSNWPTRCGGVIKAPIPAHTSRPPDQSTSPRPSNSPIRRS